MGERLTTLARALASLAVREKGLHAIYLPEFLDGLADEVTRAANGIRGLDRGGQPFAVVVDETRPSDESDTQCRRVSMGGLIKYRTGDRLAVVAGPHSVPASISGAFVKVPVGSDYPGNPEGRSARLAGLAGRALDALLAPYPGAGDFMDRDHAADRLRSVLDVLASAYEGLAQGTAPWNVYWFKHVASGLETVSDVLRAEAKEGDSDVDQLLARATYPAFGLPTPAAGVEYGRGRDLGDALVAHWASTDAALLSLDQLLYHPSRPEHELGQQHPLAGLDFEGYDARIAAADNVLLAWATPDSSPLPTRMAAFGALTEAQFFTPDQNLNSALSVVTSSNAELGRDDQDEVGPGFVVFAWHDGKLRSEELRLRIPTDHLANHLDVTASRLEVRLTGRGVWVGTLSVEDGQLVAVGHIELACTAGKRMVKKPVVVSVSVPRGDVLAGLVGTPSSPPLYPVVEGGVGIWSFDATKQGGYRTGVYRGYPDVQECLDDGGIVAGRGPPPRLGSQCCDLGPHSAPRPRRDPSDPNGPDAGTRGRDRSRPYDHWGQ